MEAVELIALASSVSLLAGWRLYLVTLVTGLAMKFGWIDLPDRLQALDVIANNWVIGIAGGRHARRILRRQDRLGRQRVGRDPLVHPAAWAALSSASRSSMPATPTWQVASFLLGGGAAFVAHAGKAGARTIVNASPEPSSNIAVSTAEDIATGGLLALAIANPIAAALIAAILVLLSLWLVVAARRLLRHLVGLNRTPREG